MRLLLLVECSLSYCIPGYTMNKFHCHTVVVTKQAWEACMPSLHGKRRLRVTSPAAT